MGFWGFGVVDLQTRGILEVKPSLDWMGYSLRVGKLGRLSSKRSWEGVSDSFKLPN